MTRAASVQFRRSILFRVIRVLDLPVFDGWLWLEGYELNPAGEAVSKRSIFVQRAGLTRVQAAPEPAPRTVQAVPEPRSRAVRTARRPTARTPIRVG